MDIEALKYPIGKYDGKRPATADERAERIAVIRSMPAKLRAAIAGLSDAQLDSAYREGGWSVQQLVHHLSDSHLNAYLRTKFALTEDSFEDSSVQPIELGQHSGWRAAAGSLITSARRRSR